VIFPRTLESRLLLACAHTQAEPEKIQHLLRHNLDWQGIVERAEHYGITPLVWANLRRLTDSGQLPPEVMEQLKVLSQWHMFRNMNLYCKLREILVTFLREEISVIPLKGAALAALVYEDISHRPMRDLDLLVRMEDVETADCLLRTLHYVPDESSHSQAWYRTHHHHLAPYVAQDCSLVLELHHHIVAPTLARSIPVHELWQCARPARIASVTTLVLAPEDLLLHISLHLSHDNYFLGMLRALCDIVEIIRAYKEQIDWDYFLQKTQAYQVEKYVYYALWLAQDMLEAKVPAPVLRTLGASAHKQPFEDSSLKYIIQKAVLRYGQENSPMPAWVLGDISFQLLSPMSTGQKIRAISKHLRQRFVYSAQQTVPQLHFLAPLYTLFIHPFYLLVRAARRAIG
jgi:Uncharacterised nucleotidyltransferase